MKLKKDINAKIKKQYDKLISDVESMRIYDGRNKGVDVYVCEDVCHKAILTRYKDKGVTPFCLRCEYCGSGTMTHKTTISEQADSELCALNGIEVKNWIRPTFEQFLKLDKATQEHVLKGGLILENEVV